MAYIGNSLAQGLISGANIQDGTVDTPDLATSAVSTAKVADSAITTVKLNSAGISPTITGGTINGAVIGGTTAAAGSFTSLTNTGAVSFNSGNFTSDANGSLYTQGNTIGSNVPNGAVGINATASGGRGLYLTNKAGNTAYDSLYIAGIASQTSIVRVLNSSGSTLFKVEGGGNVGIGTDSPNKKLEVVSTGEIIRATSTTGANDQVISIKSNSGTADCSTNIFFADRYAATSYASSYIRGTASGTSTLIFATGGTNFTNIYDAGAPTERMRIDSSGNLGVGTTSPSTGKFSDASYAFLIQSASTSTGTNIFASNSDNSKFVGFWSGHSGAEPAIGVKTGNALTFGKWAAINGTGGFTENMRIDSSGNVGIGITSPTQKLDVVLSSATAYSSGVTGNGLRLYNSSTTTGQYVGITFSGEPTTGNAGLATIMGTTTGSGNMDLVFSTRGSATLAERMRIDSSGNVGIGITSPSQKFHVAGKTYFATTTGAYEGGFVSGGANLFALLYAQSTAGTLYMGVNGTTAASGAIDIGGGIIDNASFFGSRTAHPTQLVAGNGVKITILTDGKVGIGTTTPSRTFHLKGSDNWQKFEETSGAGRSWLIGTGSETNFRIYDETANANRFVLDINGNLGIGGVSPIRTLHVNGEFSLTSGGTSYINISDSAGSTGSTKSLVIRGLGTGGTVGNVLAAVTLDASAFYFTGGGTATQAFVARSWVNFNGTGTVAIRSSGNVSSITDGGVGVYRVNFSTAMPDANYSAQASTSGAGSVNSSTCSMLTWATNGGTQTANASYIDVYCYHTGNQVAQDNAYINVAVFR